MQNSHEEIELRSFLLGIIENKKQRRKIEMRLMIDDAYFQFLEIIEEELIQEYVDNQLTESERQQFDSLFFRSKERIEKIKFAYLLRRYINNFNEQK